MREPVQLVTRSLLDTTIARAKQSPRLRMNHNFHADDESNPHRFLNALLRGTYVAPHRHVTPPKPEVFLALTGKLAFFIFDDLGSITQCYHLGGDGILGVDVEPGVWHSMAVLSESCVIYEVKPGPYSPISDKDFAPFAPREGDTAVARYLDKLVERATRNK
jgi:cupin fold WbuC family metalloprotein